MKRQLASTSQAEEPQRNVRSCISRDRIEEPRGIPPRVQSMYPHLHVPHQSSTPAPGGSISGLSVASRSLQPLAQSTAPQVGAHHGSLASSLDERTVSVSSTVPTVFSNPLVRSMDPALTSHISASAERSVSLIFEAQPGSQPSLRSVAPHLRRRFQSRTLASDGSSLSMSSEASPAGSHSSSRLTVPQLNQQHQNHMSALGDGASFFSTTPAGYQPFAQLTAQCLGVDHQNWTSAPYQNCHPVLRCIPPHLRERFRSQASASSTRELAQSRVVTEPLRDPIQSTQARQVQIARQISSHQASLPPAPFSVCLTRNPVSVSGFRWDDRSDSSAPRLRQNLVGPTSNHVRNQNPRIMPADRHSGMRMNIDNMSYEDLLALGERIGKVNTEVKTSELSHYVKKVICCGEQDETERCTICLAQYDDCDVIGKLQCSHEYHYTCLFKWMMEKAVCPICRRPARF